MARRTLGQKTVYRGLKHKAGGHRRVTRAVLTMLARNSDCLESEVEPQRKEGLASLVA